MPLVESDFRCYLPKTLKRHNAMQFSTVITLGRIKIVSRKKINFYNKVREDKNCETRITFRIRKMIKETSMLWEHHVILFNFFILILIYFNCL